MVREGGDAGSGAAGPILRCFGGAAPRVHPSAWLAPGSVVVGDVEIGADSSVWYGAVVRGDVEAVRIGERSNLQDGSVVHVTAGRFSASIGNDVTVGHRSVVHGCVVEDGALIGIGAIVLDGAQVGAGALVGAGAVVTPGTKIAARGLALGTPAKVVRSLSDEEFEQQLERTRHYVETARLHAASAELK